jgi:hypothetical protein
LYGADGPHYAGGSIGSYTGVGFQRNNVGYLLASVNGAPDTNKSDFQAQINWGDGKSSTGDLVYEGLDGSSYAEFLIKGTHTYQQANPNNGYSVSVTVNGPDGTSDGPQQTATAYVDDMPSGIPGTQPTPPVNPPDAEDVQLVLYGADGPHYAGGSIGSYAGVGFQRNNVAYLLASVKGAPDETLSDFTAQINYGDDASWYQGDLVYEGLDSNSYAEYLIKGTHTYQQATPPNSGYHIVVYVNGPDGTSTSGGTATGYVEDMPSGIPGTQPTPPANPPDAKAVQLVLYGADGPHYAGGSINSVAGVGFQESGMAYLLAAVRGAPDQNRNDFTAQINYGDSASWYQGNLVYEGLSSNNYAEYLIKGTHTYEQATPPNTGYPIVVYVNGPDGTSTSDVTATGYVSANPNPMPINLTPPPIAAATVGTAYNQTIAATGGNGDLTVTYTITSGTIPTGLSFNIVNGNTLTISGTPTAAGSVAFSVTATDSAGDPPSTQDYTLTVNPANISFSPTTIPSGTVGTAYSQTITASGGSGTLTMTSTLTPGSLPSGLSYALSGKTLTISGTPTAAGNVSFSMTATDSAGDPPATRSYTLTIIPAGTGVSLVIPQPVTTTEGQDFNGTLAIFTAQNANAKSSDFLALVSWGDGGVSPAGIKSDPNMGFDITGEHTFADDGVYVVAITITARSSGDTTPSATAAIVADAALTAGNSTPNATEGKAFTGAVASFTDANKSAAASDFTATITWGDGHVSAGTVAANGSSFNVTGTNTYAEEGSYAVTVQIADKGGSTVTVNSTMTVADAALTATGVPTITGTANVALGNVTVATFTDAGGAEDASHYTPTINWGDGTTSTGTVTSTSNGFRVSGSHTYIGAEAYTISVTIKDEGGSSSTANSLADLHPAAPPPLPPQPVAVMLVPRRFGRRKKVAAEVFFAGGQPPLEIIAPYQKPSYHVIAVEGIGWNADGTFSNLLFTAHRGKRRVSMVVPV